MARPRIWLWPAVVLWWLAWPVGLDRLEYWNNKGKGKKQSKDLTSEPNNHSFPSYDMVPLPSGKGGKGKKKGAGRADTEEDLPAHGAGSLARYVQKLVNALRKSDSRLRKCEMDQKEADEQWEGYQRGLKQSFLKERQRYKERVAKVQTEKTECVQMKEEALQSLREMFINPMGALEAPAAGGVEDEDAVTEWNELMTEEDDPWAALPELLAGTSQGSLPEGARRQLMGVLGLTDPSKTGAKTPPRRAHQPPAMSPPGKNLPPSPSFGHATYSAGTPPAAVDPYLTSPSSTGPPLPEGRSRSRSQAGTPRVPIKKHTHGPIRTTRPGALADKLEERRANVMAEGDKEDAVDVEESEDDLLSDLKPPDGPQEE